MSSINPTKESAKLTVDEIIESVRDRRNSLVAEFLNDNFLKKYFIDHYNKDLSVIKTEFLKRDLKELLTAPVDLAHYSSLIKRIKEADSDNLNSMNDDLYQEELHAIFKKYMY